MSGKVGDNVYRASGVIAAAAAGGGVSWQESIVTASTLSATVNTGYWIDTTSNGCTVTLPAAPSVGDQTILTDYARNWNTNNLTLNLNSLKYQGGTSLPVYDTEGETVSIIYSGATNGWIPIYDGAVADESVNLYEISYLVVGAGGGGTGGYGGGGGAGGYRNSYASETSGANSSTEAKINLNTGAVYTITVGGGGATGYPSSGVSGEDSVISGSLITTVTSTGGGGGAESGSPGLAGGSGGGAGSGGPSGGGGTALQGKDGGGLGAPGSGGYGGAGGGGASADGGAGSPTTAGSGGNGLSSSITGPSVARGGGAGGGSHLGSIGPGGSGGGGEGGQYNGSPAGTSGTVNTGGGGGSWGPSGGGAGGSGVVILRMADANYSGTTTGSPTVATGVSGDTVLTFNGSGSYTAQEI